MHRHVKFHVQLYMHVHVRMHDETNITLDISNNKRAQTKGSKGNMDELQMLGSGGAYLQQGLRAWILGGGYHMICIYIHTYIYIWSHPPPPHDPHEPAFQLLLRSLRSQDA